MSSRLQREDLLLHPARKRLYETICRSPGINFVRLLEDLRSDIDLAAGAGHGMLTHHLRLLERFHFVVSHKAGRFRRYFQNGGRFGRSSPKIALLKGDPVARIARAVHEVPGLSQKALTARLGETTACTRQGLSYHLRRLAALGLVRTVRVRNFTLYHGSEELADLLAFAPPVPSLPAAAPFPPPASAEPEAITA